MKYKNMLKSYNQILLIVHYYNIWILNLFDSQLQVINTKSKFKELLSELKKFKFQKILVLEYKKRSNHKSFHLRVKLIAGNSDIDEAFISMHQSIMTKIKTYASEE